MESCYHGFDLLIGFYADLYIWMFFRTKNIYAYQVGIYKEADNKDQKLKELKDMGIKGYTYMKNDQYYVLSMISEQKEDIEKHATQVKGIMKTYTVLHLRQLKCF